jgi:OOP family OmpA-OmpF porin
MQTPPDTIQKETVNEEDFDLLRQILLGEEKQTISEIAKRLDNKNLRTEEIASVLAEAIELAQKRGKGISAALTEPVENAVISSVRKNPETFASILYPSILPAIRRAIQSALNQFVEATDALIAQNFSLNAIKWRIESMRTGIPLAEILIRNTMVYRVEQVLLIHNLSGLLIDSVYVNNDIRRDSDAVSGMLSAIESFMHDSFNSDEDEKLNRVRLGNHIIYLAHGPSATLASVVSGAATPEYQNRMRNVIEQLHVKKSNALRKFTGDRDGIVGVTPLLETCLKSQYQEPEKKNSHKGLINKSLAVGLGGLFLLLFGYKIAATIEASRVDQLITRLNATEGIVVYKHDKEDGQWKIRGMIDSQIKGPKIKWEDFSLRKDKITFDWTRFQSIDAARLAGNRVDATDKLIGN